MTKKIEHPEHTPVDVDPTVYTTPNTQSADYSPEHNPVIDRRQAYLIARRRIVDTSLDEGEKLHRLGCIRRGTSPAHFIFTGKNEARTRQDLHVVFNENETANYWEALLCSCPTGRHQGDPCWHKGAIRAFIADNNHIRYANKLLALPLT
jgi:hypothetical protein